MREDYLLDVDLARIAALEAEVLDAAKVARNGVKRRG